MSINWLEVVSQSQYFLFARVLLIFAALLSLVVGRCPLLLLLELGDVVVTRTRLVYGLIVMGVQFNHVLEETRLENVVWSRCFVD